MSLQITATLVCDGGCGEKLTMENPTMAALTALAVKRGWVWEEPPPVLNGFPAMLWEQKHLCSACRLKLMLKLMADRIDSEPCCAKVGEWPRGAVALLSLRNAGPPI